MSDFVTSIQSNERATPSNGARARFTARDVGSLLIVLIGLAVLFSALLINPWFGRLIWSEHTIDKLDVLTRYAWTSVLLGSAIVFLGMRVGRRTDGDADGSSLLGLLLCLLIVFDRLLLVNFGLPLWIHDPLLHYRHRPNAIRTLARAGRPEDTVRINSFGHHDTEVPRQRPSGELRGLMVGDSITMGDQLVYEQTFSAHLEKRLSEGAGAFTSYEMINTGVHDTRRIQEPIFAALVYPDDELLRVLRQRGVSNDRIERIFEPEIRRYFLDNDHLTEAGHAVVAETLEAYLNRRGILRGELSARGSGL